MTKVTNAWQVPRFRRVWGAGAAAGLGAEIGELAIPVLAVVTLGASAAELSWVRAALLLPYLLLTLWLGVLVDRLPRRPLLVLADLARGVLLLAVCVLALGGWLTIPVLVAAAALIGSLTVLYALADFSFLPEVVPEGALIDANAKITATQSVIGVAGNGVGGLLVQVLTAPVALVLNALGYLASGALIASVRVPDSRPARRGRSSVLAEARAGTGHLLRHPVLRVLVAEAALWNLGNEVLMIALVVLLLHELALGPLVLGLVLMATGTGAFVGSLYSRRLTARFGYGRSLVASLLLGNSAPLVGVLLLQLGGWVGIALLAGTFLVSGSGIGIANSQAVSLRQLAVPGELRGRVNAGYRLVSWGALSIGAIGGGVLTTATGPLTAALVGTAAMALATVPVALSRVRSLVHVEDVVPVPAAAPGSPAATPGRQ
ncbi:MFS transporter [Auraticoccus monumenti]|uniref:Predicted arabinose efflux permease, MFS family n=1 Tax=Auraticoccus monumenti TaxID=675864 RepID=A0A1G7A0L6_9ACTN|nr:MFS transporter [Auraticoccus monumenti]SDE08362.1 Predicted arabinose efflux permease, MFS family [Auraticoccus monumenti]